MNANANKPISYVDRTMMKDQLTVIFTDMLKIMRFNQKIDQNLIDTPKRIAKMYVEELLSGCYTEEPNITVFENTKKINSMIVLGPIRVNSLCSHHFVPFIGDAYVGYVPNEHITGISKLARIVDWFSRRPQIQEELTEQIANYVEEKLQPLGVGVYIRAQHGCMQIRGIMEPNAWMITTDLKGCFIEQKVREEFLTYIKL